MTSQNFLNLIHLVVKIRLNYYSCSSTSIATHSLQNTLVHTTESRTFSLLYKNAFISLFRCDHFGRQRHGRRQDRSPEVSRSGCDRLACQTRHYHRQGTPQSRLIRFMLNSGNSFAKCECFQFLHAMYRNLKFKICTLMMNCVN